MDGLTFLNMIRLKDIAREAGVSVMTVSKALRNAPDIANEESITFLWNLRFLLIIKK